MVADLRARPLLLIVVVATGALLVAALLTDDRYLMGSAVIMVGVTGLVWALGSPHRQVREEAAETAGPGWWIGKLASKLPGAGAKIVFTLLSLGIIALGVAALVA